MLGRIGVQGQIVGQDELAIYSTLFETHDQTSLADFLEATIGPLLAHDRKRDSELAATLLAYFDSNQNAKTTAQRLGIHVNTVRQRLATIEDLLGHWGHASRALEIHIALRVCGASSARPAQARFTQVNEAARLTSPRPCTAATSGSRTAAACGRARRRCRSSPGRSARRPSRPSSRAPSASPRRR